MSTGGEPNARPQANERPQLQETAPKAKENTATDSLIYICEDEKNIALLLRHLLRKQGYQVQTFPHGADLLQGLERQLPDLLLLDIMLPGLDGLALLDKIRQKHNFPVLMLTAKRSSQDAAKALALGADDYIRKPYDSLELCSRVAAHIRRYHRLGDSQRAQQDRHFQSGELEFDEQKGCQLAGQPIALTEIESAILRELFLEKGRCIPSAKLFERVWKKTYDGSNLLSVHIKNMRRKIEANPSQPVYLLTVFGKGYRLADF